MRTKLDREFEEFVRGRSASLLRTAILLCGDRHRADDLLQQALWRTHRHWDDALRNPEAYARRVLVNLAHDGRRNARRRVVETRFDDASQQVGAPSDRLDPVSAIVERDALLDALRRLPARQRAALVLRFWDDMSVDETAQALDCSPGTVKSNTSKGLVHLRALLDAHAEVKPGSGRTP
jgi:RNA polymerase sigma-70 factor (sigma-E family)